MISMCRSAQKIIKTLLDEFTHVDFIDRIWNLYWLSWKQQYMFGNFRWRTEKIKSLNQQQPLTKRRILFHFTHANGMKGAKPCKSDAEKHTQPLMSIVTKSNGGTNEQFPPTFVDMNAPVCCQKGHCFWSRLPIKLSNEETSFEHLQPPWDEEPNIKALSIGHRFRNLGKLDRGFSILPRWWNGSRWKWVKGCKSQWVCTHGENIKWITSSSVRVKSLGIPIIEGNEETNIFFDPLLRSSWRKCSQENTSVEPHGAVAEVSKGKKYIIQKNMFTI